MSGGLPLFIDLPDPTSGSITIEQARLTPVGSDASLSPINVSTSSALFLVVDFSDGSRREMSSDARVQYMITDPACAVADEAADMLTILTDATCTSVTAVAGIHLVGLSFAVNDTRPVIYLGSATLAFSGYPDTSTNANVEVGMLGSVPCSASVYFHATARMLAYLTDTPAVPHDVSSQASMHSSSPAVIFIASPGSTRLQAVMAGSANITASFGSQTTARRELFVQVTAVALRRRLTHPI